MEPYIGEIRALPYNRILRGGAACNGQLLSADQYRDLFSLIGTIYGGDGKTFRLPDMRGRIALHRQLPQMMGGMSGSNGTALRYANLPTHTHSVKVTSITADENGAKGNLICVQIDDTNYVPRGGNTPVAMAKNAIGIYGPNIPVSNMQPFLGLTFCIALQGIFPSKG
jgi:microcystin-dependent protein